MFIGNEAGERFEFLVYILQSLKGTSKNLNKSLAILADGLTTKLEEQL